MDFFDALKALRDRNPDCNESELRSALDAEIKAEEENLKGRGKYQRAITTAYERMTAWLRDGDEYAVNVGDARDMAAFVASHRQATVYCVLIAKARKAVK